MRKLNILIILIILSCNSNNENFEKDRLFENRSDTLYTRKWLDVDFGNGITEELEVYISNFNDTITNQFIRRDKNNIDLFSSVYYDLEISDKDSLDFYNGKITLHTFYDKIKLNNSKRRTFEFAYCNQTKDSINLNYIKSYNSNTIEFKFQNYYGNRLNGKLYQMIEIDTIVNGKKKIMMVRYNVLVDNLAETKNLFLKSTQDIRERKFNNKVKLNPKN